MNLMYLLKEEWPDLQILYGENQKPKKKSKLKRKKLKNKLCKQIYKKF